MIEALTLGAQLRTALQTAQTEQRVLLFLGIYDLFSASLAANHLEALFLSGFGLAASAYGLPGISFIGWGIASTTTRLQAPLPGRYLRADSDGGFDMLATASYLIECIAIPMFSPPFPVLFP